MIYDLTYTGVTAQYESMLSNGKIRFRLRSRKKWFDNLKLHFEDLKAFFEMSIPHLKTAAGKNQGGISFDVDASEETKDDIRSDAQILESNCNVKLKFSCYLIRNPKTSSIMYKLYLDTLTKENPSYHVLRRSSAEETNTPCKKQPGLEKYFKPV